MYVDDFRFASVRTCVQKFVPWGHFSPPIIMSEAIPYLAESDAEKVLTEFRRIEGEAKEATAELLEEFRRAYNDYLSLMRRTPNTRDQLVAAHTQLGGDDDDREIHF